ncbi:MAG: hypothetical protein JST67_10070, partial [Bacteroidetes bacterium]|nr:hypothetical protein [Bacteroidota bacterium]
TYKFTNLSAGTYSFVVTKPGYGYVNKYSFQLVGGGTLYQNFGLAQLISNNVATAQAVTDASGIQINGTLSSPALGQPSFVSVDVVAFASSAPSVSAEAGHFTISSSISALNGGVTSFSLPNMFIKSQLNNAGFASGSTVYIAVYLTNPYTVAFFNPVVNQTIFTTLSSTPVIVSAIVP